MTFLDTNVLVYSVDKKNPSKQLRAREIVVGAINGGNYLISSQVLNEFSNVALLKLQMTVPEVRKFVSVFNLMKVVSLDFRWTERALDIKEQYGTQFFDSLLLAAAEASGCDEILTEDLNDGQTYCGIKVVNPFKSS